MPDEKLQIFQSINFEDDIVKEQIYPYYPRTSNFNLNDEIRIPIQHQEVCTVPCESYIYIEGKFSEINAAGATGSCKLTNNAYAFLFDQIRYEINGVEVDKCLKPGITSTMKAYVSYSDQDSKLLQMAGWCPFKRDQPTFSANSFNACIPLKFLFGFMEDHKQMLLNVGQELILTRSKTDDNCYKNDTVNGTKKARIDIEKIEWRVTHVQLSDEMRAKLLKALRANRPIRIAYRKWELHEYPALRATKNDVWPIKTSIGMEKPRYVIVGFQQKKKDNHLADASDFDHSAITNIKLHLNSESYPYRDLDLNMGGKRYAVAYHMYSNFQSSYYGRPNQPLMDYNQFHDCALYVIDCSKQNENLTSTSVDIKLDIECAEAFNKDTAVYCLILHDSIIEYEPFTGLIRKII